MSKIKIIHVIYSFEVGGIESVVLEMLNNFDKNKFECHVITITNDNLRMHGLLKDDVVLHALPVGSRNLKTVSGIFKCFIGLCTMFSKIKPDIIHAHLSAFALLFIALTIKFSNNYAVNVRSIHTAGLFYKRDKTFVDKIKISLEKLAMSLVNMKIICVSKLVYKNAIRDFPSKNIQKRLILNGIDLNRFSPERVKNVSKKDFSIHETSPVVSYVARLSQEKNHSELLDIWFEVVTTLPDAILVFAGDGPLLNMLKLKVDKLGLNNNVLFLGAITNVPELLRISDIGVFVSSYEGFGLVLIEYLAMRLPVVATDLEAFQDIVKDGEGAFLIPIHEKEKYVQTIISLLRDPELKNSISNNGYLQSQKYFAKEMIAKHKAFYLELLFRTSGDD